MDANLPASIPILEQIINDRTIPASLFQTYCRLYTAAWKHHYQHTDPLTELELCQMLGDASKPLHRSNVYRHMKDLRLAKLLTWETSGTGFYIFHFPLSQKCDPSRNFATMFDVVVESQEVNLINTSTSSLSQKCDPSRKNATKLQQQAFDLLIQAGVWTDRAELIALRIAGNSTERGYNDYLPNLTDILGWAAFCADPAQKIGKPGPIIAANLLNDRRAPEEYRPPWICRVCNRIAPYCQCEQPDFYLPDDYITYGLKAPSRDLYAGADRWGNCMICHAYRCQCKANVGENDSEENLEQDDARDDGHSNSPSCQDDRANSWWRGAIEQLKLEMPKATFNKWVEDIELLEYDNETGCFTIQAPDAGVCEWIVGRLQSTITRILTGYANRAVVVSVVSAE